MEHAVQYNKSKGTSGCVCVHVCVLHVYKFAGGLQAHVMLTSCTCLHAQPARYLVGGGRHVMTAPGGMVHKTSQTMSIWAMLHTPFDLVFMRRLLQ